LRTLGTGALQAMSGNDSRLALAESVTNKATASGYASLDGAGRVPLSQLGNMWIGGQIFARTPISDDYAVLSTDLLIAVTALSAPINVTLPTGGSAPPVGQFFIIKDESGDA